MGPDPFDLQRFVEAQRARDQPAFEQALAKYFDSVPDPLTIERLSRPR
ncbi:MAG TPA: hypothetical protein VF339_17465 [Gammaproteobacteria bacterium]